MVCFHQPRSPPSFPQLACKSFVSLWSKNVSESSSKARWNDSNTETFLKVCVEEVEADLIILQEYQIMSASSSREERKRSLRGRYYFGLIFFFINLLAWFVRDYAQPFLSNSLHYLKACGIGGEDCFHTLGVLRSKQENYMKVEIHGIVDGGHSNLFYCFYHSHSHSSYLPQLFKSMVKLLVLEREFFSCYNL
ncbi:hypothetical protein K1719_037405 [Acacia pycnantha]|nr:hypothetical protein K1719_037405 [Acacia pycnantha]